MYNSLINVNSCNPKGGCEVLIQPVDKCPVKTIGTSCLWVENDYKENIKFTRLYCSPPGPTTKQLCFVAPANKISYFVLESESVWNAIGEQSGTLYAPPFLVPSTDGGLIFNEQILDDEKAPSYSCKQFPWLIIAVIVAVFGILFSLLFVPWFKKKRQEKCGDDEICDLEQQPKAKKGIMLIGSIFTTLFSACIAGYFYEKKATEFSSCSNCYLRSSNYKWTDPQRGNNLQSKFRWLACKMFNICQCRSIPLENRCFLFNKKSKVPYKTSYAIPLSNCTCCKVENGKVTKDCLRCDRSECEKSDCL